MTEQAPQTDKFGAVLTGKGGDNIGVRRVGKRGGAFEALTTLPGQVPGEPARSIEGWVLLVSGLSPETREEDVANLLAPFGEIRRIVMNLGALTSCCVGHCFVEFATVEECVRVATECTGKPFLSSPAIVVSNAFVVPQPEPERDDEAEVDVAVATDGLKRPRD
jgi:hypothetical protein